MEKFIIKCKNCGSIDCSVYCGDVCYVSGFSEYCEPYIECNSCGEEEVKEVLAPHS